MTLNYGPIKNPKTGKAKNIVVKSTFGAKPIDLFFGGLMVMAGTLFIAERAFKYGADEREQGEYDTLKALDLLK